MHSLLLHLTPRFYCCPLSGPEVEIVSVEIPEFSLNLRGGKEICTRNPYPNKRYRVVCRRKGQKAMSGLLIQAPRAERFTMVSRWAVNSEMVVEHHVCYRVQDSEFAAGTDSMCLWYASGTNPEWKARTTELWNTSSPTDGQPRMGIGAAQVRKGVIRDTVRNGLVILRSEQFDLPTIQPERILNQSLNERIPPLQDAFNC